MSYGPKRRSRSPNSAALWYTLPLREGLLNALKELVQPTVAMAPTLGVAAALRDSEEILRPKADLRWLRRDTSSKTVANYSKGKSEAPDKA